MLRGVAKVRVGVRDHLDRDEQGPVHGRSDP